MAVAEVKHNGTRLSNADGNTDFVNFLSSGQVIDETDIFYQLDAANTIGAASKKISNAYPPEGLKYFGTAIDWTTSASGLILYKVIATNSKALYENGAPSSRIFAGSGASNVNNTGYSFDLYGNDDYPSKGGFILYLWDINHAPYIVADTGAPTMTAITQFGFKGAFTSQSRGENVIMDAVDVGYGLSLTGGTSTDTRVSFTDAVNFDENILENRFGYVSTDEGNIKVLGKLLIGRDVDTTPVPSEDITIVRETGFEDSNQTIVFPYMAVSGDSVGVEIDLHQSCTANITQCTFAGKGTGGTFYFNTETDITANSDVTEMANFFEEGDYVVIDSYGGGETPGITNSSNYYVGRIAGSSTSANNLAFYSTRQESLSGESVGQTTPPSTLTQSTAGNGEVWGVKKVIDNNPFFSARRYAQAPPTGDSASAFIDSCIFDSFSRISLTSAVTASNCTFINVRNINRNSIVDGAKFFDCNFSNHYTDHGETLLLTNNLATLSGCDFSQSSGKYGHAVEINNTGTYEFKNNSFNGYGPSEQSFNSSSIASNQITINSHPYSPGDAVTYGVSGGDTSIATTELPNDTTVVYVGVVDVNTITLHLNKGDAINNNTPITLTARTNVHYLWSADSAIHNTSGGLVTINISGGDIPTVRNSNSSFSIVQSTQNLFILNIEPNSEVRVYKDNDNSLLAFVENISQPGAEGEGYESFIIANDIFNVGKLTATYSYNQSEAPFDVRVVVMNYDFQHVNRTITLDVDGVELLISQENDRNYINL